MRRRKFTTALTGRRQVADDTVEVSFARPEAFTFHAGQYVQVRVPKLLHRDSRGGSRVFSVTSSPLDESTISIAYRETGSGFKRTLAELATGAEVKIEGPHGFATLPRDSGRPVVLVAGGIGITPFMSMLRLCRDDPGATPRRITLLYANRSPRTAAYLDELRDLGRVRTQLTVRTHFGLVDESFLRKDVTQTDATWYVAGPPIMVDAVRGTLHVLGVQTDRVHTEEFVGY